jgi:hypothetical protein
MLVAMIAVALGAGTFAPAASAENGDYDPRIAAALQAISNGTYTEADLEVIRSEPDIAAQVPDPTQPEELSVESSDLVDADGYGGNIVRDLSWTKKSFVGRKLYTWHFKFGYNYQDGIVTNVHTRYDYTRNEDAVIYIREITTDFMSPPGRGEVTSNFKRHLEYCLATYGCYANTYPWAEVTMRGNGSYSYRGGAS